MSNTVFVKPPHEGPFKSMQADAKRWFRKKYQNSGFPLRPEFKAKDGKLGKNKEIAEATPIPGAV